MLNNFLKYPAILICCFIFSICNVSKSDQTVSEIQTMLKDQGYNVGIVDGISGKKTVREIKNWQFLNGFFESGKINENQINTLRRQNSRGKKLNNNEMKTVKERNKSIKEKNKKIPTVTKKPNIEKSNIQKKEKGSIKTTVIWWGVGIAFILMIIGDIMKRIATPKKDRRFRTGYENNASVDEGLYNNGESVGNIGGLMLIGAIIFAFT